MSFNPVIFREYDIRGVYQTDFDLNFSENLGFVFARSFSENSNRKLNLTLGYDARLSSPEIAAAVSRGMRRAGANVVNLGLITSPLLYFSTFHLPQIDGGLMVTGSHNPPEFNGFKLSMGQQTIFGDAIQKLRKTFQDVSNLESNSPPLKQEGQESFYDIRSDYVKRYQEEFGADKKDLKIILDCGNGAAGCVVRRLFNSCGLEPEILFEEPDGRFPNHHPDPTVEKNLKALQKRVLETGAHLGIGFDGDADRIGVVDEKGRMVFGDELMVVISRAILAKQKGSKIIGDVKCSDRLFLDIQKNGGEPILWKTGHSLIKEKIKVEKAPFGGEMSGHIFFADRNYGTDDALYAALRICEILILQKKQFSQLLEDLPCSFNTPEIRIDTTEEKKLTAVEVLRKKYSDSSWIQSRNLKVNFLDGVRISYPDGWALVRSSNTQPVLVMRFESSTEEGLQKIRQEIEGTLAHIL